MPLNIKWPKAGYPVRTVDGAFPVWGRADHTIIDVVGLCRSMSRPDLIVKGRTISYYPHGSGTDDAKYRWMILFRIPEPGDYRVTVIGQTDHGATPSASVEFSTLSVAKPVIAAKTARSITILWPDPDEDITDYKDDFSPYGVLTQRPLGSITMTGSNDVPLLYSYGDYIDLQMWTAQFDTVPSGTYALTVHDNLNPGGAVANALNLTVT